MIRSATILFLFMLAACSSPGQLSYQPTAQPVAGPAVVADVQVVDQRDEKPNRIATIRGGYGNPLKVMDTSKPVADEVRTVFLQALTARGMLRGGGPGRLEVILHTLYGDQFMGRKVDLVFDVVLRDRAGRVVYSDRITGKDYEFTFFDNGMFASIETLGRAVQATLSKSVDEALDKVGFRLALDTLVRQSSLLSSS